MALYETRPRVASAQTLLVVIVARDKTTPLMDTLQCEVLGLNHAATREVHRLTYPPPSNFAGGSAMSAARVKRLSLLERVGAITRAVSGHGPSPNLRYALDR